MDIETLHLDLMDSRCYKIMALANEHATEPVAQKYPMCIELGFFPIFRS
jgi:hypothetical protein